MGVLLHPRSPMTEREIRLAGSGGQGLILGARMLFRAVGLEGKHAAQSQSYEPTSRGGFCHSDVVVSESDVDYPLLTTIDVLLALDQVGLDHSTSQLKPGALVVLDERLAPKPPAGDYRLHTLPLTDRAIELGNPRAANIVGLGVVVALDELCGRHSLEQAIRDETPARFLDSNLAALGAGFELAAA